MNVKISANGLLASAALAITGVLAVNVANAADEKTDQAALAKAITKSKLTLLDGLRQATKPPEVPISAKFEFDDAGKLSLSVYTAGKGVAVDAENNVLKELSGSPETANWKAEVEVFKDLPHVSRASQQLTLVALSRSTLSDIVAKAQKHHPGIVFSITPVVRDHKAMFVVLEAFQGKIVEFDYGVLDGKLLATAPNRAAQDDSSYGVALSR